MVSSRGKTYQSKLLTLAWAFPIVALIHSQVVVPAQLKLASNHQEVEKGYYGPAHHQGTSYKNLQPQDLDLLS